MLPLARRFARGGIAAAALLLLPCTALADEVLMKNGDRLTGKIQRLTSGSLSIDTEMAGTVVIPFENVVTFSTDEPVDIRLQDGSALKQKVGSSELERTIDVQAGETLGTQPVSLDHVTDINPRPAQWDGSLTLGAEVDTGNTEEKKYRVRFEGSRRTKIDRINFTARYDGERTKSSGDWSTTKRESEIGLQYDYFFTERQFVWAGATAEKDGIAEIDLRLVAGAGHGIQWVERDDLKFNTQVGVTWVSENYSDQTDDDDYIAGRVAYRYENVLWTDIKFFNNVDWIPSFEDAQDHLVKTTVGLRTNLTESIFGEARVDWEWDSTPADNAKRQDVTYLFGLGWSF